MRGSAQGPSITTGMPSPTGSEVRPWPSVVGTSHLHQGPDQVEIAGGGLALLDPERGGELGQIGGLLLALLPSRQRSRRERADHLRDVEPANRAIGEHDEYGAAKIRQDGALAVARGAHHDLRLHLAVELVEIGDAPEERQGTDADEIAGQRVNRI